MNASAWFLLIAIVAAVVTVTVLLSRSIFSSFGKKHRKSFGAAAVALLGLERFIRPAQEHVQQANDGEVDQDAIGSGLGPQEWLARSTIRANAMLVDEEESWDGRPAN